MVVIGDILQQKCVLQVAGARFFKDGIVDALYDMFKIFCGLNCYYGSAAHMPWTFLQQDVFKLTTPSDDTPPTLKNLQKHLQCITNDHIATFDATFQPQSYLVKR
jgi:hypothetical protein